MDNNNFTTDSERERLTAIQKQIPGNQTCFGCGLANPKWASVTHGVTLCLACAGVHRSLGTHNSFVRSLTLDDWSEDQLRCMEAGGNAAAAAFFTERGVPEDGRTRFTSPAAKEWAAGVQQRAGIQSSTPQTTISISTVTQSFVATPAPAPAAAATPAEPTVSFAPPAAAGVARRRGLGAFAIEDTPTDAPAYPSYDSAPCPAPRPAAAPAGAPVYGAPVATPAYGAVTGGPSYGCVSNCSSAPAPGTGSGSGSGSQAGWQAQAAQAGAVARTWGAKALSGARSIAAVCATKLNEFAVN